MLMVADPITIYEVRSSANGGGAWLVECHEHTWFKEMAYSLREFAEDHAARHKG